jgi:hypothetical protein
MDKEGKYIYCIIGAKQERNFGPIGIGGRKDEVLTIDYNDLSMVVSNHPLTKFVISSENLLSHERVIEEVMKEFEGVLPVRFGTIAQNSDEIRNLLDRRYREFKSALIDMDKKVELGVKAVWKNMKIIFKEIAKENREIQKLKEKVQNDSRKNDDKDNAQVKMEVSKAIQKALENKKEREAEKFVDVLRKVSVDYEISRTAGDEMFMNAAFLVDKGREKEFDNIMDDLSKEYEDRIKFIYTGPLPVFNFVNIVIYPEKWER